MCPPARSLTPKLAAAAVDHVLATVAEDGQLSRIANWATLTDAEKQVSKICLIMACAMLWHIMHQDLYKYMLGG